MKRAALCLAVLVVATTLPARGHAQSAAAGPATLDTLLQEVRLLRKAIEKQTVTTARTQLLMGRVTLQDQRLARARESLDRAENDLANAEREHNAMQSAAAEMARRAEEDGDAGRRSETQHEVRTMRERLADHDKTLAGVQARQLQARQSLDAESARYDELESSLRDLDRDLQRDAP